MSEGGCAQTARTIIRSIRKGWSEPPERPAEDPEYAGMRRSCKLSI